MLKWNSCPLRLRVEGLAAAFADPEPGLCYVSVPSIPGSLPNALSCAIAPLETCVNHELSSRKNAVEDPSPNSWRGGAINCRRGRNMKVAKTSVDQAIWPEELRGPTRKNPDRDPREPSCIQHLRLRTITVLLGSLGVRRFWARSLSPHPHAISSCAQHSVISRSGLSIMSLGCHRVA